MRACHSICFNNRVIFHQKQWKTFPNLGYRNDFDKIPLFYNTATSVFAALANA